MICSITGCSSLVLARGWCPLHYQRWRRFGRADYAIPTTPVERFWSQVSKSTGCWLWTGVVSGRYGQIKVSGRQVAAHRFSFDLHLGAIPSGMFVCHRCDTPLCVRPDHLFLGDSRANMLDMSAKGRHPKTLKRYRAKLTVAEVREIRVSNEPQNLLASRHGVSTSAIFQIKSGRTWKSVI